MRLQNYIINSGATALLVLLCACGDRTLSTSSDPNVVLRHVPAPSVTLDSLLPTLDSVARSAADVPPDPVLTLDGSQFSPGLYNRLYAAGTAAEFHPQSSGGGKPSALAWGIYFFSGADANTQASLKLSWQASAQPGGGWYCALARWGSGNWSWQSPDSDGLVLLGDLAPYISEFGVVAVAVVATAGQPTLERLELGLSVRPTARLTVTPASGPAPLGMTLDASASTLPLGPAEKYEWDFNGDGFFETYTTVPVISTTESYSDYAPNRAGSYSAAVRVTGPGGLSDTATAPYTVTGFARTWGTTGSEGLLGCVVEPDGSCVACGSGNGALLVRFAPDGSLQWVHSFQSTPAVSPIAIAACPDGGFAVAGLQYDQDAGSIHDAALLRYDSDGVLMFARRWGTVSAYYGPQLTVAAGADGTLFLGGDTTVDVPPPANAAICGFVVCCDADGTERWRKGWMSADNSGSHVGALAAEPDGGVLAGGGGSADDGLALVRLSSSGGLEWDKTIMTSWLDRIESMVLTPSGEVYADSYDAVLIKLDADLNVAWARQLGLGAGQVRLDGAGPTLLCYPISGTATILQRYTANGLLLSTQQLEGPDQMKDMGFDAGGALVFVGSSYPWHAGWQPLDLSQQSVAPVVSDAHGQLIAALDPQETLAGSELLLTPDWSEDAYDGMNPAPNSAIIRMEP